MMNIMVLIFAMNTIVCQLHPCCAMHEVKNFDEGHHIHGLRVVVKTLTKYPKREICSIALGIHHT